MTDYEIAKQYENWLVPPEWAYDIFAGLFALWIATTIVAATIGPWVNG